MQSIWIGLLGLLLTLSAIEAVPVDIPKVVDDAETRIIIPPELPPLHFEILKEKLESQDNCTKDTAECESTPLNFLRATEDAIQNITTMSHQPIVAFEGNKQIPIYITIPIFINPAYQAGPIVGVDNPVVSASVLRKGPEPTEESQVTPEEVKMALKELLRDALDENHDARTLRPKKKSKRSKQRKAYRD